jgi:hypothetical protein
MQRDRRRQGSLPHGKKHHPNAREWSQDRNRPFMAMERRNHHPSATDETRKEESDT